MEEEPDRTALGAQVRLARTKRGWSKEKAAVEAGISAITWKRIEDGVRVQDAKLGLALAALDLPTPGESATSPTIPPLRSVGGSGDDADSLLYRKPDGLSDLEWERLRSETREYLEWLIERATRER